MDLTAATPEASPSWTALRSPALFWGVLALVSLLALATRFYKLAEPSFWEDELFTVKWSQRLTDGKFGNRWLAYIPSAAGMMAAGVDLPEVEDDHTWTWRAAGINEWNARSSTALIGFLSIPLLAIASRRILSPRAVILLAILLTLSTWHLWMSQVARFYMQQFLFYNLALVVYYDASERKRIPGLVAAAVLLVLAYMSQLTSVLLLGVVAADYAISLLRRQPVFRLPPIVLVGLAILGAVGAAGLVWWFWGTYNPNKFTGSPQPPKVFTLGYLLMVGLPTVAAAALAWWWLLPRQPRLAIYLGLSIVVPPAVFLVLGALGFDVHVRYTFVALYAWMALAAIGLDAAFDFVESRAGWVLASAPAAMLMSSLLFNDYVYFTTGEGYRPRWREAFAYVERHRRPGEAVWGDFVAALQGRYYLGEENVQWFSKTPTVEELRAMSGPAWIVFRATEPAAGRRSGELDEVADLRAYFNTQNVQPFHSLHVYYLDPAKLGQAPEATNP